MLTSASFAIGERWTGETGTPRAIITPEPGKKYRFEFLGIHEPNMHAIMNPIMAKKHGFRSDPATSEPIELKPATTIRLRFVLSKEK
jgi:hypothetical protein